MTTGGSKGKEYLRRLNEALTSFEQAITRREHKGLLDGAVTLQQDVDSARQRVIEAAVQIAKEARETYGEVKK